ncbi:MAG TPA: ATP-binding protein [Tepidisphaeraceae bacterium]
MQYVVALLIVGAAAVLTRLLLSWGWAYPALTPLFLVAVAVSAWIGGVGPGLMATAASLLAIGGLVVLLNLGDMQKLGTVEVLRILSLLPVALFIGLLYSGKARAEQALRERDARLQLVSEQIPGGLWSTDTELHVTSGFGAQAGLLHGPAGTSLYDHFKTQDSSFEPIAAHRRALRGVSSSYQLRWCGRTFQSYVEPLRDVEGNIIGVVGIATDITDREAAEDAIRQAKQQLEAANHAKDRFLAMLSHELRTPLTPVLALASSLAERADLPATLREDLEMIRRNTALEATLIDDLLDLTRISRGKLQLNLQEVDAHELLRNAVEICRPDGEGKEIAIELELSATRRFVRADAARLQQVFWNLIKNAVKFTPAGGRVRVRTADHADGKGIHVEVADTGIGIEPELLPRIFDAFEQGASSITRQFGGLGLGLAISKALVDAHGGRIAVQSDGPGKGATFVVEMETAAAQPSSAGDAGAGGGDAARAQSLRILLVEDHADSAKVMRRLLRAAGHQVETACTVASAREALVINGGGRLYDLVISDLGLPDGNGLELMGDVKRYGCRAIALSGYGTEEDVQRSMAAGFAAHLTKPVPMSTLRQAIARVSAAEQGAVTTPS